MYKIFAHTADSGLLVEAASIDALFADAAQALFSLIVSNPNKIEKRSQKQFNIAGGELEYLLVDWLSELLFAFESEHWLFSSFEVSVGREGLSATAVGEKIDESRHRLDHEVKAITYHGLKVEQTNEHWVATVIVDI